MWCGPALNRGSRDGKDCTLEVASITGKDRDVQSKPMQQSRAVKSSSAMDGGPVQLALCLGVPFALLRTKWEFPANKTYRKG